jgi:hypothetical protein
LQKSSPSAPALRAALQYPNQYQNRNDLLQQSIKLIVVNSKTCLIYQFLIFIGRASAARSALKNSQIKENINNLKR